MKATKVLVSGVAFLLVVCMSFVMVGCGSKDKDARISELENQLLEQQQLNAELETKKTELAEFKTWAEGKIAELEQTIVSLGKTIEELESDEAITALEAEITALNTALK